MRLRTGPSMTSEGEGAAIVKSSERGGGREMGWSEHHQERVVKEGRGQLSEGFERFLVRGEVDAMRLGEEKEALWNGESI